MPLEKNRLNKLRVNVSPEAVSKWAERRDIPIAILAWTALGVATLWAAGYVIRTLLIVIVAALLAYALMPAVKLLERVMPRVLAILIVYLVVLSSISVLLYFVVRTAIDQIALLVENVRVLLTPTGSGRIAPLVAFLGRFGISEAQLNGFAQQILNQAQGIVGGVVPLLTSIFDFVLDIIIVAVLSIYLLIDGARVRAWINKNAPLVQRERVRFAMNTLERVAGGYIRGQLILSLLIGLLVGIGMTIFGIPYSVLLGVLAFVLEFIPVLGTLTSGALCVVIALTAKGWLIAVGVLIYFIIVHVIEGDVVGPRIVGKAVGLHPAVSLIALIAGAELFGIWGAILASPITGLVQALLVSLWQDWRATHPDQFPTGETPSTEEVLSTEKAEKETTTEVSPPPFPGPTKPVEEEVP